MRDQEKPQQKTKVVWLQYLTTQLYLPLTSSVPMTL